MNNFRVFDFGVIDWFLVSFSYFELMSIKVFYVQVCVHVKST